ncbi:hypothetical protein Sliba_15500 [Streptomyces nigrescens]|uniref:Uncharacterized protein n=1 Tax=Streptomyces nigrescens TaxID=1920 RepID=A0A640TBJ7_STRNI|nr:hypothetical protein Sliba_15500 [Streptomyces libani subsp. libani]GGV88952.1 hypothetical protein GCM10010500_12910 [Streptomyces libani subsp. libani]
MIGQTGALISDNSGEPVWFRPLPSTSLQNADFKVQTYHHPRNGTSEPVLTWWQGSIAIPPAYTNLPGGAPEPGGCYYIYDSHYHLVRTVFARHGFHPDEHEFILTRRGTALFIATKPVPMDLSPYGGPDTAPSWTARFRRSTSPRGNSSSRGTFSITSIRPNPRCPPPMRRHPAECGTPTT